MVVFRLKIISAELLPVFIVIILILDLSRSNLNINKVVPITKIDDAQHFTPLIFFILFWFFNLKKKMDSLMLKIHRS